MGHAGSPGILLLGNHPPPYGGVPVHIQLLARHLVAQGWRVHILSEQGSHERSQLVDGYWVHRLSAGKKLRSLSRRIPTLCRKAVRGMSARGFRATLGAASRSNFALDLVRDEDLHLLSAYHLLNPGLAAAWAASELHVPLATTIFGEIYADPDLHRRCIADLRTVCSQSSLIMSCSRHCAASLAILGITDPVQAVHYGVDTVRFLPDDHYTGGLRAQLGLPELSKVIIFVGRMVREMGLHTVLAAAPRLLEPDGSRHLVIVGARGALTAEAENLARRFPGHVHVLPDLADADLPAAYALSTVAVAPSTNERACLGLAIIEAMASGLPVVGCAVGGTAEVVVDGETGTLIPPESPEDLVRATEQYLSDRALARVHGHRGRIRAVEHFDLGVVNRRIESMFLDLIRSPRERASGGTP